MNKELSRVERVVAAWDRVRSRREEIVSLTSVLEDAGSDEELRAMASAERDAAETKPRRDGGTSGDASASARRPRG